MSYQEQTTADQTVTSDRDERLATRSIADTVSADPNLSRLAGMLRETGLDRMLQDGEWLTLLAPGDAAIARMGTIPEGDALHAFVRHHLMRGARLATDLAKAGELELLDGGSAAVTRGKTSLLIANATIVRTDMECTNGVIHEIDQVLA